MPLLDRYDCFLLDLDGVLYRGTRSVPGAPETVARLRQAGKRIVFVTNNSARTPEQVAERLAGMGVPAEPEEVVTSALATAALLRERGGGSAFVIGEGGVRTALADAGIAVVDGEPDRADFVVVGWDRTADYAKLRTAALLVRRGARLVATNADASYPAPDGLWPGAGALLAAVTTATGAEPEIVGKPHAPLFREAHRRGGGGPALAVGDRLETDVAGAAALGMDTLLVLSGVVGLADLIGAPTLPTFLGRDLSVLAEDPPPREVRPAEEGDVPEVARLLEGSGLSADGVEDRLAETLVAAAEDGLAGTAALELFGPVAHLRSVVVREAERGRGLGALLVAHGTELARARGATEVYAVTETAERFFTDLGFQRLPAVAALPPEVRETPLVREQCSSSAAALRLALAARG